MRKSAVLVGCLLLTAGCVLTCGFTSVYLWSGGYDLTVAVSAAGESPEWVYCFPVRGRDRAEGLLDVLLAGHGSMSEGGRGARADPFRGEPPTVRVALDGRRSPVFGERTGPQVERHLVVVAQLPGGRRVGRVVDIPDCRAAREVAVALP